MTKQYQTAVVFSSVWPVRILLLGSFCLFPVIPVEASLPQTTPSVNHGESRTVAEDSGNSHATETKTRRAQTRRRLILAGISGFGTVSLLSVLFVYLRLNHATRGFYSRRLQAGAAVIAFIVLMACVGLILIVK